MKHKPTGELRSELEQADNLNDYLESNGPYFMEQDITKLLNKLFVRRNLSKSELARRSGISEVYLHQVFSKRRTPSRDRLLCLCIGLEATLDETQRILMQSTYAQLYPKLKRDSIISYGLLHHMTLGEINDKLFLEREHSLC